MSHREKQLKKSAVRVVESDLGVIDLPYLLLTLLLVAIGLLVLFSASYARAYYETKNAASVFVNQLIFAVMGIGVMWIISRVPYEWYQKLSLLILAASIGLPFIGTESGGATRWLDFGFVSFQPSEIAKFGVICSFAAIMAAHTRDMKTIRYGVAPYVVILGIIAVLLYLEPHMSATLIILALGFILMTLGGTDWKYLVGLVILGCLLVAVYLLTKGYTGGRISAWLHPENDPLDKGLQVLQSQYAIGSGGLLGLGFEKLLDSPAQTAAQRWPRQCNAIRTCLDRLAQLEAEVMEDLERFQVQMRNLTVHELLGYRARKKPLPLLVGLFDYLREQGAFLHAVLGSGGDVGFGPRLRDSLCTNLVQSVLHERYRNDPEPFVGYYVAFFASAYLGVITRWIETGMRESSEEMALIAMRLFFIKPGESIKL